MDSNIGKKLDGRYELLELIGVGGMADIYRARDIVEDRIVAVKILKTEFAGSDEFLRRFRNESKAIALLSHPNIVKIYDGGFTDKVQFIVMEYVDGITLTDYIEQQGVLKWRDAVHFTVQILKALQHAHDRGIVHRDIKSSNVMLLSDGTIKVMDFGIARFNRENNKTVSEKTIGSVHYISPEQARGDITDERSDIYSVGVALYEMLTGRKPFDGDTPVSIALMHMQSTPKKPTEINSTIPEGLEQIVLRAMQKDPAQRYQTAGEMIKDLEEFKANPSIIFEYKYNSTDGTTKYFDRPIPAAEQERNRRKQAVRTEPEEDYEEDDYDEDDEDEIIDLDDENVITERLARAGKGLAGRLTILALLTAAAAIAAVFYFFKIDSIPILSELIKPDIFLYANLTIGILSFGACSSVITNGFSRLFKGKPDGDTLCAFAHLGALGAIVMYLAETNYLAMNRSFCYLLVSMLALCFNTVSKLCTVHAAKNNFRFISGDTDKYFVECTDGEDAERLARGAGHGIPVIASMRKTEMLCDFIISTYCEDVSHFPRAYPHHDRSFPGCGRARLLR